MIMDGHGMTANNYFVHIGHAVIIALIHCNYLPVPCALLNPAASDLLLSQALKILIANNSVHSLLPV